MSSLKIGGAYQEARPERLWAHAHGWTPNTSRNLRLHLPVGPLAFAMMLPTLWRDNAMPLRQRSIHRRLPDQIPLLCPSPSSMNIFDAVVLGFTLVAIAFGFHAGLLRSLAAILGYVVAAPLPWR